MPAIKIVLALALACGAELDCDDKACPEGKPCLALRAGKDAPTCKDWGPKKCERKTNSHRWEETVYCPPGDLCDEYDHQCDCVGEKANGARKCLGKARTATQCAKKETNPNNAWVITAWCEDPTMFPTEAVPTVSPTPAPSVTAAPTSVDEVFIMGTIFVAGLATPVPEERVGVLEAGVAAIAEVDASDTTTIEISFVNNTAGDQRRLAVDSNCRNQALSDPSCIHQFVFTIRLRVNKNKDAAAQRLLNTFKTKLTPAIYTDEVVRIAGELGVSWPSNFSDFVAISIGEIVLFDPTADPTAYPTAEPTTTADPSAKPTASPTSQPTFKPTADPSAAQPTAQPTIPFPSCGVRVFAGDDASEYYCEANRCAAARTADRKLAFSCCPGNGGASCTRTDASGQCYLGDLSSTWGAADPYDGVFTETTYEDAFATCAADGKTLCATPADAACTGSGCYYNFLWMWSSIPCDGSEDGYPTHCTDPSAQPTYLEHCTDPSAQPTVKPTADPSAPPTAYPTAKPTADPTAKPTADPTSRSNLPFPEIMDCLRTTGIYEDVADVCGTCCPACVAVNATSFENHFEGGGVAFTPWTPKNSSTCVCLDLVADGYGVLDANRVELTTSADCARITGQYNYVYGLDGADALVADGYRNFIFGGLGDDYLAMDGTRGVIQGKEGNDHLTAYGSSNSISGDGGDDVCTDASGLNSIYHRTFDDHLKYYFRCERCLGPGDVEIDCATGATFAPTASLAPSGSPTVTSAPTTFRIPATTAERTECLSGAGSWTGVSDVCGTCCPACAAVTNDTLANHLEWSSYIGGSGGVNTYYSWTPTQTSGCLCLDLEVSDYNRENRGFFRLTDFSDCIRITGDYNTVLAQGGDDAVYVNGESNNLYGDCLPNQGDDPDSVCGSSVSGNDVMALDGDDNWMHGGMGDDIMSAVGDSNRLMGWEGDDVLSTVGDYNMLSGIQGNDQLTAAGDHNSIDGGPGEDICTDLGTGNTFHKSMFNQQPECESCFGPGGVELSCDTGETFAPTVSPVPTPGPSASPAPTTAPPTANPTAKPTAKPTADPTAKPTADPTADPTAQPTPSPTLAPTGLAFEEQSASATYADCKTLCGLAGGRMPCIADADDNEKLKNFVADACVNGEANPWLGIRNPFPDTDNEANTVASNWDWRDSGLPMCDADTTNYHAFEDPEPNNSDDIESCAEMKHGDGGWNDIPCDESRCCLCDMTFSWEPPTFQKPEDPPAKDADALTKTECATACDAIGARLPCIGSEGENQVLLDYAQGACADRASSGASSDGVWLGAEALGTWTGKLRPWQGHWEWPATTCSADLAEYYAWRSYDDQPDNFGGSTEDCAELYLQEDSGNPIPTRIGSWNDIPCGATLCCVCDVTDATPFPTARPTTAHPTAKPTADPTADPTAAPTDPTAEPSVSLAPTVTQSTPQNLPTADIVACFQNSGDCQACCPACDEVVPGQSSFTSKFVKTVYTYDIYTYHYWKPSPHVDRCVCLDLDKSGYGFYEDGAIYLTPYSDCARITGNSNDVIGDNYVTHAGDDAMYTNGVGNWLFGYGGDDHLAAGGSGNCLYGGDGNGDVCTDLSGSNTQPPYTFHSDCYDANGQVYCGDRRKLIAIAAVDPTA